MGKSVFGREDRKPLVKNIVVGIIGAALCVWGIVALFAVLNGDRLETAPGSSLASDTQASSAPATDPPPTTASTTAATTGTAESADPPGSVPPEAGDAYFNDAVFIGDSRTEGLMIYGKMPEGTTFCAVKGLNVNTAATAQIQDGEEQVTILEGRKRHAFKKVYVMLGVNELGWASENTFIARYGSLLDGIREAVPDAVIYVQSILPVSKEKSDSSVYTNSRIQLYNSLIVQMCEEKGAVYLNVAEAVQDESGALPAEATVDGIHLKRPYYEKWKDYIMTHTVSG